MKVFISWSGERSKRVAEHLKEWLDCVIPNLKPFVSSKDIQHGSWWFSEISDQLAEAGTGILCITSDNKDKPWILFEAGAISKGQSKNRVVPFLIDLTQVEVGLPLSQLHLTDPSYDSVFAMAVMINGRLEEDRRSEETILKKRFDAFWVDFEETFKKNLSETFQTVQTAKRSDREIMEEMLSTIRSLENRLGGNVTVEANPLAALLHLDYLNPANSYYAVIEKNIMNNLFDTDFIAKPAQNADRIDQLSILFHQKLNVDLNVVRHIVTDIFRKRFNYEQG